MNQEAMDEQRNQIPKEKRKWQRRRIFLCSLCNEEYPFCWTCPCGFMICSDCMEENLWGMTCNGVVWTCPDCGEIRGFGND